MKHLAAIILLLMTGCAHYSHIRPTDHGQERTSFWAFMMLGNASKIHVVTKDGTNYSRTVNVGTIAGAADTDAIKAVSEGLMTGAIKGMKTP